MITTGVEPDGRGRCYAVVRINNRVVWRSVGTYAESLALCVAVAAAEAFVTFRDLRR